MSGSIVLRADGGPGIGNGHVMRCLALAEAWMARRGTATLAAARLSGDLRAAADRSGVAVFEPGPDFALVANTVDWVVIDGYHLGVDVQRHSRGTKGGTRIAVIDDHGIVGTYEADLVVDQNLDADPARYPGAGRALAGSKYALLRRAFLDQPRRSQDDVSGTVDRVLVALGGTPPADVVDVVQHAVAAAGLDDRAVVLGPGVPVDDMPSLLASVDLALSAAGTFVWELCYTGVPMVLLPIADNQVPVAERLARRGACVALPRGAPAEQVARVLMDVAEDTALRRRLVAAAGRVVDGRGAARVVTAMKAELLLLRAAGHEDAEALFRWANEPTARANSFRPGPIAWEEHLQWLAVQLADEDARITIAADRQGPVGQFRARRTGREAVVGVVVDVERRGEGWAPALIDRCSRDLLAASWADTLHAWVKQGNAASRRAFEEAGYGSLGEGEMEGHLAVHYARRGDDIS